MKTNLFILLSCSLIIGITEPQRASGWRGLVPLHSTREDVVRVLGQPTEVLIGGNAFYRTVNETVIISYAQGRPCGIGHNYSQWRVPRDTVESILVTPTKQLRLSELGVTETRYKKASGGHLQDNTYYINELDGVTIRVFRSDVMSISLYPGLIDAHLSCFPRKSMSECEGLTPPPTDSYGEISITAEKIRLDNFALLIRTADVTGYIVAYAGKTARKEEAKASAERAKSYLVKTRKLPPDQVRALDGGFQENAKVELYVVPRGACPPVAAPTLDPRDVKIIEGPRSKRMPRR